MENPFRRIRRASAPEKPLRDELLSIERLEQRAKSLAATLTAAGVAVRTSTPAEFSTFIRKEAERWSTVVKDSGMKYD